ncbi:enoyl-CoA hydratase [Bacillus shivajii]|uniref:enoyl-CoA hydratase n=1 Tax=Bacillus shivajii TaxID=1983719 RepID=UPI001CFA3ECC|nr:enoyl-CoA hydratase [Bacillus shivajii]UCZ52194.1 enoyl-CoA hydratase [Bacillus shivajii]
MTEFTYIKLRKEERIAFITLNHPPANTLSQAMFDDLDLAFSKIEEDEDVKAVVVHGEGRFFAAGADIKEFTMVNGSDSFSEMARKGQRVFKKIETFSKPVIASIHGAALGGGLELAMACHIRLVAEDAKLGLPELQLGLIPGFAGTQRLPRLVGRAKATEMLLTSDPITGKEAVKWGLANHAHPQDTLLEETEKLAKKVSQKGAISVSFALELLQNAQDDSFDIASENEAKRFGEVSATIDAKEGIQAFIEKRKPNFKDK